MDYLLHILILIGIYIIVAISLNLAAGYTGLVSLGHAAFYGIGAYTVALMGIKLGTPFWINIICATIIAGGIGLGISIPSLRVHDDYFILATFGFQVVITSILTNWVSFTGGPVGLFDIPQPKLFGIILNHRWQFLILIWLFTCIIFLFYRHIVRSPFGRVVQSIREDEILAKSIGKSVTLLKIVVFVLASASVAIAGSLYAVYITFIDPASFTVHESIFMLSIVIIGGSGNLWGSVIGAVVLLTLPELLRFVGLPSDIAANIRQILYGGLIVMMMFWRPQGLLGKYTFNKSYSNI